MTLADIIKYHSDLIRKTLILFDHYPSNIPANLVSQKHHGNQKKTHVSHKLHFDIFLHKGCSCKNCRSRSCSPRIICKISTICFLQRPETSMWKGQITEAASRLGSQRFLKWNHISGVMKWRGGWFYRIVDNWYSLWWFYREMLCNFYGRITIILDIH